VTADAIDAVVIGAGPNGLVAANVLADAGGHVLVLEANAEPGGAVRTAQVTAPGFRNDLFSAFYPFTAASPVMRSLALEDHGLRWSHAPAVVAHARRGLPSPMLYRDVDRTAAGLDAAHPGDGAAHRGIVDDWRQVADPLVRALLSPFPPVRGAAALVRRAGVRGMRDLARLAVVPLRRYVHEQYGDEGARALFAGMALHADLTPESAGSAIFGWLLVGMAHDVGFPVPVGGAGCLTDALVTRLRSLGGEVRCGCRVDRVLVRQGRAEGVVTAAGERVGARRAVVADCDVTTLYVRMVGEEHLPAGVRAKIGLVERSSATVKVDWALSGPIPWADPATAAAGTVHIADDLDELTVTAGQLAMGHVPSEPFLLVGQMTTADPSRSPPGTESAWAYTHVPQRVRLDAGNEGITGAWDGADRDRIVARMEARIEAVAPGFADCIIARHVMTPPDLQRADANLVGGDISGGTAQLHQQLVFRPVPGFARSETPVRGLYLGSASAHPGGAVHGACGSNAARAALAHHRVGRLVPRAR
jgi:phytoene dehydrogenase-like protein